MTPLKAFPRLRHRPSRLYSPHLTPTVVLWCVMVLSVHDHHHVLVRAQFAANPTILNPTNALLLNGIAGNDESGISVSGVGDVNGDNVEDFVVGSHVAAPFEVPNAGQAYLLFGRNASTPWTPNPFELSTLDGTNGVALNGVAKDDAVGAGVSGVNDVNGDNINDFIIGTLGDKAYVLFGVNGTWPATVNLTQGAFNGFTIMGQSGDQTGISVSDAGDVNNDGIHDIAVGVRQATTPGGASAGRMDVLYGRPSGSSWPGVVDLTTYVNASTGFSVLGENVDDLCGHAVSGVGDVDGDGVDDAAVGCVLADPHGITDAGIVAVVFGSSTGLPVSIKPSQLNGTNGFVVNGQRFDDRIGSALSLVGDVNADGLHDFAIGAPFADTNALVDNGEMYVLLGCNASESPWPAEVNVNSLDGNSGFTLAGSETGGNLGVGVSAADVDGDGIDDVLVGADLVGIDDRGFAFLLYGRVVWPAWQNSSDLDGSNSNTFEGSANGDRCGRSVSLVGDVDGDGRGDLGIGCPLADPNGGRMQAGQTAIVFGPLFTPAPTTTPPSASPTTPSPTTVSPTTTPLSPPTAAPTTTLPTTASPVSTRPSTSSPTTTSTTLPPTSFTCAIQGTFIPPGATCLNDVLVTTTNTTAPAGTSVMITTSVTITGGASFEQPSGSTLVFVAKRTGSSQQRSTSIAVEGGGCASIEGTAVVSFEEDPTNGGEVSSTDTLVLVTADCVTGKFSAVSATTSFEGDECVAIGDGEQQSSGSSISVSFAVSNSCDKNGLSIGVLAGIIAGGVVVMTVIVVVAVKLAFRARERRALNDVRMSHMKQVPR